MMRDDDVVFHNLLARLSGAACSECGRVFDLSDENDVDDWYYGHDCEDSGNV
jgi:hypothetical protein